MKGLLTIIFMLMFFNINSQVDFIEGGGTLDDWANLAKYRSANLEIIKNPIDNLVVFMGNSITESWSTFRPNFFQNNSFLNRGISGQTTPQMLIRFKPDVVNLKPNSVVILAGINDIAGNTGPMVISNIAENIFSMSEIAKEYGINVYICSVLPAKDFPWSPNLDPANKVIRLNEILKDYCVKNDIVYVDYYSKMNDGEGGLKVPEYTSENDLVHPNSNGYALMESVILNAIKKDF